MQKDEDKYTITIGDDIITVPERYYDIYERLKNDENIGSVALISESVGIESVTVEDTEIVVRFENGHTVKQYLQDERPVSYFHALNILRLIIQLNITLYKAQKEKLH